MSIGNLKSEGNRGTNFPWQLKMLLGQQCTCDSLKEIIENTDAVESLLFQILSTLQNGTDYEAALVLDNAGDTWLEVRVWNTGTGTFDPPVYYLAGSNTPGTPVAPITYINPNSYLAQIVSYTSNLVAQSRTHNVVTATGAGSIPANSLRGSVINAGNTAGVWNGQSLPAGITIPWGEVGMRDTYGAINYDATGTTFVIEYTT